MQNIPDKGVSHLHHYLQADATVTGLTGVAHESQGERWGKSKGVSNLGHGMTENLGIAIEPGKFPPWPDAGMRSKARHGIRFSRHILLRVVLVC
jgi:hypothetical protein